MVLAQGLGDAERQAPRDEKGTCGLTAVVAAANQPQRLAREALEASVAERGKKLAANSEFAICALPQVIPVANLPIGGIGSPWPPPTLDAFLFSFPRTAKACLVTNVRDAEVTGSRGQPSFCSYCGFAAELFQFLTAAQVAYVEHYGKVFGKRTGHCCGRTERSCDRPCPETRVFEIRRRALESSAQSAIRRKRNAGYECARVSQVQIGERVGFEECAVHIIVLIEQIPHQSVQLDILADLIR